jgi:hypothetical protein
LVPRDLFNSMAILALTAIFLAGVLSVRAFADDQPEGVLDFPPAEVFKEASEASREDQEPLPEDPPADPPEPPAEESPEKLPDETLSGELPEPLPDETLSGELPEPLPDDPPVDPPDPPAEETPEPLPEEPPGATLDASEEEASEDDLPLSCAADVAAIRQSLELLVYGFLPLGTAFFLVYKFCMLFYSTFIRDVL